MINNKRIKLIDTYYVNKYNLKIGQHIFIDNNLYIGCKIGALIIKKLQFENKKIISNKDFSNITSLKNTYFE